MSKLKAWAKAWGWAAVLAAGIGLLGIGILRGEPGMILEKAIRICLECIGIG